MPWVAGTARQGSRNVEFAAAANMKRTWVNYGQSRNWADRQQGQVGARRLFAASV